MSEYDYTQEDVAVAAEDFEIANVVAPQKSAEEIEAESSFEEIPPGVHELVVVGFLKPPKAERKDVFVDGQRRGFDTHSVVVKFALPDDRGKQVTDFFLLPPGDPEGLDAYHRGSKGPQGKVPGFNSNKFFHFLERLGYPVPKGGALPAEARKLGNWVGRRIVATVVEGDAFTKTKTDTETGEEVQETKPGRNQIKLFSYRPAGSTISGPVATPRTTPKPAGRPAGGTAQPTQATAPARPATNGNGGVSPAAKIAELEVQLQHAVAASDFVTAGQVQAQLAALKSGTRAAAPQTAPSRPQVRQPAMAGAGDRGLGNI